MGKGIWKQIIIFMAIMGFLVSFIDFICIKRIKKEIENKKPVICVVDIWKISTDRIIQLASIKDNNPEITIESIDTFIKEVSSILKDPDNFGCDIIAVKGTLLSNNVDITDMVRDKLLKYKKVNN